MTETLPLLELTKPRLAELLAGWGQPRFRADQVWDWIYKKYAAAPAEMTNLPAGLRERLRGETLLSPLEPVYEQRSGDGQTIKWLFRLPDGLTIETVLMFYDDVSGQARDRRTACISTQAGCAMGCVFCATGQAGLARNLTAGEIVAQVLAAARWLAIDQRPPASNHLTNIVVMGMGEPFANYDRTWAALRAITDPDAFGLGARHITVSTVGLPQGIRKMAQEPLQVNLAVSLHAPNDALRSQLLPVNRRYPIDEVLAAVREYIAATNRRVTFEYALMAGINDTPALAAELAGLLRPLRNAAGGVMCHVNLIPLNPVAESPYQPSTAGDAATFRAILERNGIPATVRMRRGIDIDAGCGQLRRRVAGASLDFGERASERAPVA